MMSSPDVSISSQTTVTVTITTPPSLVEEWPTPKPPDEVSLSKANQSESDRSILTRAADEDVIHKIVVDAAPLLQPRSRNPEFAAFQAEMKAFKAEMQAFQAEMQETMEELAGQQRLIESDLQSLEERVAFLENIQLEEERRATLLQEIENSLALERAMVQLIIDEVSYTFGNKHTYQRAKRTYSSYGRLLQERTTLQHEKRKTSGEHAGEVVIQIPNPQQERDLGDEAEKSRMKTAIMAALETSTGRLRMKVMGELAKSRRRLAGGRSFDTYAHPPRRELDLQLVLDRALVAGGEKPGAVSVHAMAKQQYFATGDRKTVTLVSEFDLDSDDEA